MPKRRCFFALLIALASTAPVFGDQVDVDKLAGEKWISVRSENFDVLANSSRRQTVAVVEDLENFSFFVSRLLGYKQKPMAQRVPIVLAKSKSTFAAMGMDVDAIMGVFTTQGGGFAFARTSGLRSSGSSGSWGRQTILHELTHLLTANVDFDWAMPAWYTEGIAEYFATYLIKKNQIILGDSSLSRARFRVLRSKSGLRYESIDSESLLKTPRKALRIGDAKSSEHEMFIARFYGRSLALVHYLNADPERRKQLHQYLSLTGRGYSVDETFAHVFDISYSEFDEKVDAYLSGRYMLARVFDLSENGIVFPEVSMRTSKVSRLDALSTLQYGISLLGDDFLGDGVVDKMNADMRRLEGGLDR